MIHWGEWIPNDGQGYGPDFGDREVIEVKLGDGTTRLAANHTHGGGSCGCCSGFSWNWYGEDGAPEARDVVAYRKLEGL